VLHLQTLTEVDVVAIEDIPPIMRKHNFKIEHRKSRLIQGPGFDLSLTKRIIYIICNLHAFYAHAHACMLHIFTLLPGRSSSSIDVICTVIACVKLYVCHDTCIIYIRYYNVIAIKLTCYILSYTLDIDWSDKDGTPWSIRV